MSVLEKASELIDALGGIEVNVPKPILSNKFECPYPTQARCDRWPGWRFAKGQQHMDGRRALIYSRVRQNQLDPSESDITRGERQQTLLQAMMDEIKALHAAIDPIETLFVVDSMTGQDAAVTARAFADALPDYQMIGNAPSEFGEFLRKDAEVAARIIAQSGVK